MAKVTMEKPNRAIYFVAGMGKSKKNYTDVKHFSGFRTVESHSVYSLNQYVRDREREWKRLHDDVVITKIEVIQ